MKIKNAEDRGVKARRGAEDFHSQTLRTSARISSATFAFSIFMLALNPLRSLVCFIFYDKRNALFFTFELNIFNGILRFRVIKKGTFALVKQQVVLEDHERKPEPGD